MPFQQREANDQGRHGPLDGTPADDLRLGAAKNIADTFDGQVIGLFLNPLPLPVATDLGGAGAIEAADLFRLAKDVGDRVEADLIAPLSELTDPAEFRRFDVLPDETVSVATREARSADTFVALRPNGALEDPARLVEGVLFGSGRHLFLAPTSGVANRLSTMCSLPGTAVGNRHAPWPRRYPICIGHEG